MSNEELQAAIDMLANYLNGRSQSGPVYDSFVAMIKLQEERARYIKANHDAFLTQVGPIL